MQHFRRAYKEIAAPVETIVEITHDLYFCFEVEINKNIGTKNKIKVCPLPHQMLINQIVVLESNELLYFRPQPKYAVARVKIFFHV